MLRYNKTIVARCNCVHGFCTPLVAPSAWPLVPGCTRRPGFRRSMQQLYIVIPRYKTVMVDWSKTNHVTCNTNTCLHGSGSGNMKSDVHRCTSP